MNPPSSTYEWKYRIEGNTGGYPLLWLHGFMGAGDDWLDLAQTHFSDYCNILLDLPGHGGSIIPSDAIFATMLTALPRQLSNSGFEKFIPIGYSMGGRIGFHLQKMTPKQIPALVFLSSAPGLKTMNEREQRTIEDGLLMDKLDTIGIAPFLKAWYSSALFGGIKKNSILFSELCHTRSNNDTDQLRQALSLMGNGALPSLWDDLKDITIPALLMTGELDSKYLLLNQEINHGIAGSIHHQVADAGHAFHLEKPLETARIIRHFLSEIIEGE